MAAPVAGSHAETTLSLIRPDDWHVHLREGAILRAVLPYTAAVFGRAIVMPNLPDPVTTTARAITYRDEIRSYLQAGQDFTPLMTIYLTDGTTPEDLGRGFDEKVVTAAKLYPAHATTNSDKGVTNLRGLYPVLEHMQRVGMPLLLHGEVTDSAVDIFDREAVFIDRVLIPLRRDLPKLKIVFEHITTKAAAAYVEADGDGARSRRRLRRIICLLIGTPCCRGTTTALLLFAGGQARRASGRLGCGGNIGQKNVFPRNRYRASSPPHEGIGVRMRRDFFSSNGSWSLRAGL